MLQGRLDPICELPRGGSAIAKMPPWLNGPVRNMTDLITKLVAGSTYRKTRLHDESGNWVSLSCALRNGPRAIASWVLAKLGHRPVKPWISYDAQKTIEAFLGPTKRVLEFGSGMSTVWYAERAGEVVSIEDSKPWFELVQGIMCSRRVSNVRYHLAEGPGDYATIRPEDVGIGFDFVMIDGSAREACAKVAISMTRPGGIIYLDNSDKCFNPVTGDIPAARRLLLDFAERDEATVTTFTDFAPTQLFVQEGLLVTRR